MWGDHPEPYRPHLPHPEWFWLPGYGEVELVEPPTPTQGGESIESIELMDPGDAVALLRTKGDWESELIAFACAERRARMLET